MEKIKFECSNCLYLVPKWLGHCIKCNSWNSFIETNSKYSKKSKTIKKIDLKNLSEVGNESIYRICTGIGELDRVLGGGIVQGSLTLIGGQPGVGKSTLLLEAAAKLVRLNENKRVLYISGEESEGQISLRAKRLNICEENIYLLNENDWEKIKLAIDQLRPIVFILDSIQTTVIKDMSASPGSVSQIKEITYEILNYCKDKKISSIIVGHITKDGSISGPKVLEHMVDTVLYFEGLGEHNHRILKSIKNRFGNTFEVGLFEMEEEGLIEISDTSKSFIKSTINGPGRTRTCILEGRRVLFLEIQALVNENKFSNPKRITQGIDNSRLSMLIAIIEKYAGISLINQDVYINVVGGFKVDNKEIDLAIVASILSSYFKITVEGEKVFLGEVGLSGEIRGASFLDSILKDLEILNYKDLVIGIENKDELRQKFNFKISALEKINDLKEKFFNL